MLDRTLRTLVLIFVSLCAITSGAAVGLEQVYEPTDLPGSLQSMLSDQHIVIYVTNGSSSWDARHDDDTVTYSLKTDESARVESLNETVPEKKSFEILLDHTVLAEAVNGDSAQQDLLRAYRDGAIRYRGVGFWNSALTFVTKTTMSTGTTAYSGFSSLKTWMS